MKVALIDYGAGNLRSVANALRELDVEPCVAASAEGLADATHLILPGVGSFGDCMNELERRGLTGPIRDWLAAGKPYMGICLGYHVLFEESEESPGIRGLGFVRGGVRRFQDRPGLKIPHMGWNSAVPRRPGSTYWDGLGAEPYFYYVHSYFPVPEEDGIISAETEYGLDRFASAIELPQLFACQFHPEKSQTAGLRLIRNFLQSVAA